MSRHTHRTNPVRQPAAHTDNDPATPQVCDFCGHPQAVWMYRSTPIAVLFIGAGVAVGDDLGQQWRACAGCAAHIEADDAAGLLERTLTHAPAIAARAELADSIRPLQSAFLAARLPGRTPITPPPPVAWKIRPDVLPKVRDRLAQFWTGQACDRLATALSLGEAVNLPAHILDPDATSLNATVTEADTATLTAFTTQVAAALHQADLFFIDETFTQLAVHAGRRLPNLAVEPDQVAGEYGLIVWGSPIDTLDVAGRPVPIVAAHWGRQPGGVWTCFYTPSPAGRTGPALQQQREQSGWLAPISTGVALPYRGAATADDTTRQLLSTLVATWLLIDQPTFTDIDPTAVDKRIRRAYARAGRAAPQVRLVRLRPRTGSPASPGGSAAREYTHRWWVDPYWRDQPYGPGRALRKRRLVAGSVRGPGDKPLVLKPTVRVLGSTRTTDAGPDR
jgi:hypothetical protein